jgi:hypothetical protein
MLIWSAHPAQDGSTVVTIRCTTHHAGTWRELYDDATAVMLTYQGARDRLVRELPLEMRSRGYSCARLGVHTQ